jgi:immune inhibitor A
VGNNHYRAVVILIQFPDWPADTLNHPPSAYDSILFSVGTVPTGSLRDYYREVSRGVFDIDSATVTRWYTAPHPYSYYANNQAGIGGWPNNAQQLAADAVALADPDVNFSRFDNDGPDGIPHSGDDNGKVDALFIVHSGPGWEETGLDTDIQSHEFNLIVMSPVDGVFADAYTTEPEEWAGIAPYTTPGQLISMGVYCHELGHVLGLIDLYDTDPNPSASEGIGEWDLMGTGVYTHPPGLPLGTTPAHLSAWSKIWLGWVTPVWVTQDSLGVTIPPVETGGPVYRLWTSGLDTGEYFLLENRQPLGFDSALVRTSVEQELGASHGLLIYHVNENVATNNNPAHKKVDVVEAGGVEGLSGVSGAQNLDLEAGILAPQTDCGLTSNIRGNRGDRFDPWPGGLGSTTFDSNSCPGSSADCGAASQVAVRGITEIGGDIGADFYVTGATVQRLPVLVDDPTALNPANNGNGLAEPGETVNLHFPIQNLSLDPAGPLHAKVGSLDSFTGARSDSVDYGVVGGAAIDSGTVIVADINMSPDPAGASFSISLISRAGLVERDSAQILVGTRTGICSTFENTNQHWTGIPSFCGSVNEWHREAPVNHTEGGSWAWRCGPVGLIGSYAVAEDARLVSQPIRLAGSQDTLTFWQRYDTSVFAADGLSVEISTDGGVTWLPLQPLGGYPNSDKWGGFQPTFVQAIVPLTGYSGIVQIAFRFTSQSITSGGLGWWIDDVVVGGTASCATTAIVIESFHAAPDPLSSGIRLEWRLGDPAGARVALDRAAAGGARERIAALPEPGTSGSYLDRGVLAGEGYDYWLTASRQGEPDATWGPVRATAPASAPPPFALGVIRPNPFNPSASVTVSLDRTGPFVLRVYRADGTLVRTLADAPGQPGVRRFLWDGTDDRGAGVGSGIYFFELLSGSRTRVQKAILLR